MRRGGARQRCWLYTRARAALHAALPRVDLHVASPHGLASRTRCVRSVRKEGRDVSG